MGQSQRTCKENATCSKEKVSKYPILTGLFLTFPARNVDPYCRLRIPIYRKAFEAAFFISFLVIYYAVLAQRDPNSINALEILMYIWITAFAYDELSGITDAGMLFYQLDFWSLWNVGIIGVGIAFLVCRESLMPWTEVSLG